jgi:hypothetical protein
LTDESLQTLNKEIARELKQKKVKWMGGQHTFDTESFELMCEEAFKMGEELRAEWNLESNHYLGEDTGANRALMEAFIHGVIGRDEW